MLSASHAKPVAAQDKRWLSWWMAGMVLAGAVSALWIAACLLYVARTTGFIALVTLPPAELGIFLLGLCSVPGMIAMTLGYRARLRALDRANRGLSRHFREFVKFAHAERSEMEETSEAAKRESLSLFEAAQSSLAALGQAQGTLKQNTQALIGAATTATAQLNVAGKLMETRAGTVKALSDEFKSSAEQLQGKTADALGSVEAVIGRMEKAQAGWAEGTTKLDEASERTVSRLHASGDAIHVTLASIVDATNFLETRRLQVQRTTEETVATLQQAGDKIVEEISSVEEQANASAELLTKSARQAADRIAESAGALDEQVSGLGSAGAQLASQVKVLAGAGLVHVEAMQAAASDIGLKSEKMTQDIAASAEQIGDLSSQVASRLSDAASQINAGLEGVRTTVTQTSQSVSQLGSIGQQVSQHRREMEEGLSTILERLDLLATRFKGEIDTAGDVEQAIGQAAHNIIDALKSVRLEQEATNRELDAFGERSQGVSLRLEGLRSAAVNGASDLITEADRLQSRSEALTDELKGQSIAFSEAINRADGIAALVKHTGTMIQDSIANASETSRQLRGEFETVGHAMDTNTGKLQAQAQSAAETLGQAKARMEESIVQIGAILGSLDGKAGDINFTVSTSISRLGELTHGLERAREEVLGSSEKVAGHIGQATETLMISTERMRQTAEQVTTATAYAASVGGDLSHAGEGLRDRVIEISGAAQDATEKLRISTDSLSQAAECTKEQLEQIAREVRHENEAITNTLGRIASVESALRSAGTMIDEIVAGAEKAAEGARGEMHAVGREIALQSKVLVDTSGSNGVILSRTRDEMEVVVSKVQDAFGSLNQKASEINFVVSTAVNRLGELSRGLETASETIEGATGTAAGKISGVADKMRAEFTGVHEVADRALERLEHTLSAIAATSATIDAETQTIEQRLANTYRAAETGSAGFTDKVGEALEKFEKAEQSLVEGQARLVSGAEDATAHFLRLARELASGGSELGNAALVTGERIVNASDLVQARLAAVNEIADQVRTALGTFAADLGGVAIQANSVTQAMAERGEVLRDNVIQIGRSAEEIAETMKVSTAALLGSAIEISDAAGKTKTEIVRATSELRREGTAIAETEAESRALAAQVSALLGERAMELAMAARKVAAETMTMREEAAKTQRNLFLGAAKTVLDALGSLSVDISRVLDNDLPEELRTELVRGDIPGFVRRLAKLRDQVSTPRLRAKFATDSRFRTHVQAYLGQFEQLVTQAAAVEQGEVLSATLISSDIGKIYTFLSAAISTEHDDMQQTA